MAPPKNRERAREKTKDKDAKAARDEFEVAFYTKELSRPLQRKLLQRSFSADFADSAISAASHGEDVKADEEKPPPREDRAG
jgi:hypothetical protein